MKNVAIFSGGNSAEHNISLLTKDHVLESLKTYEDLNLFDVLQKRSGEFFINNCAAILTSDGFLEFQDSKHKIDYIIPCFHGHPGETGHLAGFCELLAIKYFGCGLEASSHCWNKATTKMWLSQIQVPNTPFIFLTKPELTKQARRFFDEHKSVFVKASGQGSSVGCYEVNSINELQDAINKAFGFYHSIIIEKNIKNKRELEVAVYEYEGRIFATHPGEVIAPEGQFYDYDQKYSSESKAKTHTIAPGLSSTLVNEIQTFAKEAFRYLGLKHIARVDFFLTDDKEIFLNEINTFPGMTSISLFPKMLENNGHDFGKYLYDHIIGE